MPNFTAYFKVKTLCCDDYRNESGFIPANTLAEAVEQLEEYFKNDLVAIIHMELVDTPLITMPEDVAESILEYNF
jgi:hypothetical protein